MDEAMEESGREHKEQERMDRFYNKLVLQNKIIFCEKSYAAIAFPMSELKESRQRMTKEIAQELIEWYGPMASLHCLEKLIDDASQPQMWRDVMSWIDELQGKKNDNDDL
jgi:hypothetical protein